MKISSASKKVLASALSAAMVVAFAPTVALAAESPNLTDDQAKALGYTVKATTVATSSGNSVLNTVYYKDLADAFNQDSGVKLALTLMADQDGAFATDATAEDTISIDTNGFKITNSKDESQAPLTASAGKYTGKYGSGSSFTGGSYSVKPGTGNYNSASYVVVDDGEFFNVEQAKNFKVAKTSAYNKNVAADSADDKAILAFAENLLQDISAGKVVSGIDAAKKSKTVKLAKKATKTKKAQSFSMGVSAETAVTTAKKSGSKYVTVKGGKVTLKKGVKKGTYAAKVTVKAAASDQYLAATKTVTVKFTVKK